MNINNYMFNLVWFFEYYFMFNLNMYTFCAKVYNQLQRSRYENARIKLNIIL